MLKTISKIFILVLFIGACSQTIEQTQSVSADQQLQQIITDEKLYQDSLDPYKAENNILIYDASPEALAAYQQRVSQLYKRLQQINSHALSDDNVINWTILSYKLKNDLDSYNK